MAIAAAAGAMELWRGRFVPARLLVVGCTLGVVLHTASLSGTAARRALPAPIGAAVVSTDDEADVDRAAHVIDARSRLSDAVLVNPLLAVVAERREVAGQADWFILRALERSCGSDSSAPARCRLWAEMKRRARGGDAAVVGVDSNVRGFDPSFARDTETRRMARILHLTNPPLELTLYARSR
jgi:hypothetical protein